MNVGRFFLSCYNGSVRVRAKCLSLLISGAFASFGRRTVIVYPFRLSGVARIKLGDGVFIGSHSWLQTLDDGDNRSVAITVASGTSIAGACVISAVRQVCIEENVLIAQNVYISDHIHRYDQTDIPILAQGVDKISPVLIKRGAWIGQNAVVCPGVTIGMGSVIGANSVVNRDIPDYCVAAGAPARVVKTIEYVTS